MASWQQGLVKIAFWLLCIFHRGALCALNAALSAQPAGGGSSTAQKAAGERPQHPLLFPRVWVQKLEVWPHNRAPFASFGDIADKPGRAGADLPEASTAAFV